jgi:hypothetical protein
MSVVIVSGVVKWWVWVLDGPIKSKVVQNDLNELAQLKSFHLKPSSCHSTGGSCHRPPINSNTTNKAKINRVCGGWRGGCWSKCGMKRKDFAIGSCDPPVTSHSHPLAPATTYTSARRRTNANPNDQQPRLAGRCDTAAPNRPPNRPCSAQPAPKPTHRALAADSYCDETHQKAGP